MKSATAFSDWLYFGAGMSSWCDCARIAIEKDGRTTFDFEIQNLKI